MIVQDFVRELAQEFVFCYRALRDALGDTAALASSYVQAARRRYVEARA